MAILSVQDIGCSFGERTLFSSGSFLVEAQDKIGLIGGNGVGKTTLFQILAGFLTPSEGQIAKSASCRIGYLEQHALKDSEETLFDAVKSVFAPLFSMEAELAAIADALDAESPDAEKLLQRQHLLTEEFQARGGLTWESRLRAALRGIGFSESDFSKPVSVLSGGERTMASLVRLLLSDATLLLLDEPTNHLDMDAVIWLEDYLRAWRGAVILISHDRYFLDRVTNKTIRISGGRFTMYTGGYTEFTKKRQAEEAFSARKLEKQMREIKRIEGIIETQHRFNRERNIRMAESKQKQIDRIRAEMEAPILAEKGVSLRFLAERESGGDVLFLKGVSKSFDDKLLFRDISLRVFKNDRMFLIGPNGCGKTTLMSVMRGAIRPDSGTVTMGTKVDVGYFDQKQANLSPQKTALAEVRDAFPKMTETELRAALASLGLRGDAVHTTIETLSGGERAKVALCKLLLSKPNFLLLDEPTNHLDIDAKECLEEALSDYNGTMLVISHDRYFIDKLATRIASFTKDGVFVYEGSYQDYLAHEEIKQESIKTEIPKKETDYRAEKAKRAEKRKIAASITRTETQIAKTEAYIAEKTRELEDVGADYQKAMGLTEKIAEKEALLEALYDTWTKLTEENESAE